MAVMTAMTPTASVSYKPKMRAAAASEANRCNSVTAAQPERSPCVHPGEQHRDDGDR